MSELFSLLKHEWILLGLIALLLILKIRTAVWKNESLISLMNALLLFNFLFGWILNIEGEIFGGMFRNTSLIAFQKNILNLALLIIHLQSVEWMKRHKHLTEFYVLLFSSMLGMFFLLSSGNLLMFYLA